MNARQYLQMGKQWLYISSCLCALSLLPHAAEAAVMMNDMRVNNAPDTKTRDAMQKYQTYTNASSRSKNVSSSFSTNFNADEQANYPEVEEQIPPYAFSERPNSSRAKEYAPSYIEQNQIAYTETPANQNALDRSDERNTPSYAEPASSTEKAGQVPASYPKLASTWGEDADKKNSFNEMNDSFTKQETLYNNFNKEERYSYQDARNFSNDNALADLSDEPYMTHFSHEDNATTYAGYSSEGYAVNHDATFNNSCTAVNWNHDVCQDHHEIACYEPSVCCQPSSCFGNFRIFGDFLYWNVNQDGLDYALEAKITAPSSAIPFPFNNLWFQGDYKQKSVSFTYKPGFRVGGFYELSCQGWELGAIYTHFRGSYHNHESSIPGTAILSSEIPTSTDFAALIASQILNSSTSSRSHFHLSYDVGDILATTSYTRGSCLTWQPYIGARFVEIKEHWNVDYAVTTVTDGPTAVFNATSNWHSKLPAGGVTFGVNGSYSLCQCLNLIGRLGASCVGGTSKQRTLLDANLTLTSSSPYAPTRVCHKKNALLSGLEGSLGLAYHLQCCNVGVQFAAGYEFQSWFNLPTPIEHGIVIPGIKHNSRTDLHLHGLFVRAGVSF